MKNVGLILVGAALATVLIFTTAQDQAPVNQQNYGSYSGSLSVERLASRMERFMKMHVEVVRNQMQLNSLLGSLLELEINNAQNGRFTHISDSTYFDTMTAEIFRRPAP